MRLLLQNVRLETGYIYDSEFIESTKTDIFDVLIENGRFKVVDREITGFESKVLDAEGQLLVPSFREMHTHIDKTYFSAEWKAVNPAPDGIFSRFEEESELLLSQLNQAEERAHALVRHYINNGHTHIRTHVNVDPFIRTKHMEIVKRVLESYKNEITYEMVAFPQHGLFRNGSEFLEVFEEALKMGPSHIGGVDPSTVDKESSKVIKKTFDLAEKYQLAVDIHLHEPNTLGAFDIEQILNEISKRGFKNGVTISHAFAFADIDDRLLEKITERMAEHNVDITTSIPIGSGNITIPVKYLYDSGVNVSTGHDSLTDHWSPFGTGDTVKKLNQLIQRFGYIDEHSIGQSLKYSTGGITPLDEAGKMIWPKPGDKANALLVDAVSSAHLIARQCPISTVISKGNIIHKEDINLEGEFR